MPVSEDRLLDAAEVAQRLNVPVSWVREHTRSGLIPHVRLGRYVRFEWQEVERWLETRRAGRREEKCHPLHPHPTRR